MQPLTKDEDGVLRFQANKLVDALLEHGRTTGFGLNELCTKFNPSEHGADWQQLSQLIGYSLSGYGSLSYVDDEAYNTASYMAQGLDERNARIVALESKLAELRLAINKLREPVAHLLEMHPDDLRA